MWSSPECRTCSRQSCEKAVEVEQDIVIVAQVDKPEALTASIAKSADVIVTAAADRELAPQYLAGLFGARPIPVVAISADGNSIDVYGRWATRGYGRPASSRSSAKRQLDRNSDLEASNAGNRSLDDLKRGPSTPP